MELFETAGSSRGKRQRPRDDDGSGGKRHRDALISAGNTSKNLDVIMSAVAGLPVSALSPFKFGEALQTEIGTVKCVKKIQSKMY